MPTYIVVDVEGSGLQPHKHDLLSIGACVAFTRETFYAELKPVSSAFEQQAMEVNKLDLGTLAKTGKDPRQAMQDFHDWILRVSKETPPVFAAFPGSYDWGFVSRYFHEFLGANPFQWRDGENVRTNYLEMKSFFAAKADVPIQEATQAKLFEFCTPSTKHTHNALEDAVGYCECLEKLLQAK